MLVKNETRSKVTSINSKHDRKHSDMRIEFDNERGNDLDSVRQIWKTEYQTCRDGEDSRDDIVKQPVVGDFADAVEINFESEDQLENDANEENERYDDILKDSLRDSSVIIDQSDFKIFDEAGLPNFNLADHLKRIDKFDLSKISWETKLHDIYNPDFTSHTPSRIVDLKEEKDKNIFRGEKRNFSNKYSFQNNDKNISGKGMDYFHSDVNVLMKKNFDKGNMSDIPQTSPHPHKLVLNELAFNQIPSSKSKNYIQERVAGTSKKPKKDKLNQKDPPKNNMKFKKEVLPLFQAFNSVEELTVLKYKSNTKVLKNALKKEGQKVLKKKNSVVFPQTRSNSRENLRDSQHKEIDLVALRSLTKDRGESPGTNLKKKVRIRDREEALQAHKDITNSVFIKRKKKKVEVYGSSIKDDKNIINKIVEKKLKQKKESSGFGISLNSKPTLNLEHSNLTEDLQSKRFQSDYSRSPKYEAFTLGLNSKLKGSEFMIDEKDNEKKTLKNSKNNMAPKKQKKSKSITKKKHTDTQPPPKNISGILLNNIAGGDTSVRKSQDKSNQTKLAKLNFQKSIKKDEIESIGYNLVKSGDLKTIKKDALKNMNLNEEMPYYSQRSKTTQKIKYSKKIDNSNNNHTFKNVSNNPLSVISKNSGLHSPGKNASKKNNYGKNSSSLLER